MAIRAGDDEMWRFRSGAPHYVIGRSASGPLPRRVAALVGLGREDAMPDLGCGPRQEMEELAR